MYLILLDYSNFENIPVNRSSIPVLLIRIFKRVQNALSEMFDSSMNNLISLFMVIWI